MTQREETVKFNQHESYRRGRIFHVIRHFSITLLIISLWSIKRITDENRFSTFPPTPYRRVIARRRIRRKSEMCLMKIKLAVLHFDNVSVGIFHYITHDNMSRKIFLYQLSLSCMPHVGTFLTLFRKERRRGKDLRINPLRHPPSRPSPDLLNPPCEGESLHQWLVQCCQLYFGFSTKNSWLTFTRSVISRRRFGIFFCW